MSRISRLLLCLLALSVLLPVGTLSERTPVHPAVGIGDNKLDMFSDPKFLALGIKYVRYDVSWDALSVPWQRAVATRWLNDAKAHGMTVLLTIDYSKRVIWRKVPGHKKLVAFSQSRVLPTEAQYIKAFKAFRAGFPWVTEFATWDETNYYGEATYDKETLVASYYKGMRAACPICIVLAAEFLDVGKREAVPMTTWVAQFDKALGYQPGYWGLNNYEDANHLVTTSTRQLLAAVSGNVWLAETGGIVNRPFTKHPGFPQNAAHAAVVDHYLLNTIGSLSQRIQRIYFYEWNAKSSRDSWDTALISYTGAPRDGYAVLAQTLSLWGIRPNCAISLVPPTCTGRGGGATLRTGSTGLTSSTGSTGATAATGPTGVTSAP
jgi:hypothetical protein